jgi:autotransporter-associated beta strand protein
MTWTGVIGGAGQLVKSGGGELNLTANNTYAGGTRVTGGVIRINSDANLGAAGTGITLDGGFIGSITNTPAATTFTRNIIVLAGNGGVDVANNPITWGGNISGAGQFIKSGNGELSFGGTNTYAGGTLVRRGTLKIVSDGQFGAAGKAVTLDNNGALRASETFATARPIDLTGAGGVFLVDDGKTFTLQGTVGGTNLTKVANGTLVLAGHNQYTGTTSVFGGTLRGDAATIRGNVAFNDDTSQTKTVVFDQVTDATFAGNIGGVGTTTGIGNVVKTGAGRLVLSGTSNFTGTTTVSAGILQGTSDNLIGTIVNNAGVIFDQGFDGAYAGAMSGAGTLTKNGTGTLSLTGASSVGGGTTINGGGFAINGSLTSDLTLNAAGTLYGSGHLNGNLTNNGGTIAPGNSIGNLTINGNLTWNSGTFDVEVSPSGASDRITIVGAGHKVTVNGGTLQVLPLPGTYVPNTRYTIITAPAGGIATFNDVTGGVGFLTPALSFDDTNLYLSLVLAPDAFRSAGQTVNQQAIGGALDALAASGNVGGVVTTMANLSPSQGAAALQALSPEAYADFGTVNTRSSQLFMNAVGRQMAGERGSAVGAPRSVALAEACEVACDGTAPPRLSAWLSGIGSTGSVLGNGNASSLTYTLGGTAFGIDYRLDPRFLLGIAGGYAGGTQWVNGFGGNGYTDALSVALYGSFTQNANGGGFYADALAGYANSNNRLQRVIPFPGQSASVANGQASANQFLGQLETGYKFGLPFPTNTSISPFGRLQVGSVNQAAFTESGTSPFNLSVAQQTTTSVRTIFGADFGASFDMGGGRPLDIGLRLGWMHEFADTARPISAAFAAAPIQQFTVFGATPQRDSAVIGLSATAAVTDRASLFASYDGEVGGGTDNHALRVGFRMTW